MSSESEARWNRRKANWNRSYVTISLLFSERQGKFEEVFNVLNYKPYPFCFGCKYNRNYGISAEVGEKSNISGAIALIRCILRIEEQLYNE